MFRFRGRIKLRTLVVLAVCLVLVLLPVSGILLYARRQISRAEIRQLHLEEQDSRQLVLGNGLNINRLTSSNLVLNGGFEPIVYRRQLLAASGDRDSLLIVSDDQELETEREIPLDGFFDGASVQVLSRRGSVQNLKKESIVTSCRPDHVTAFHSYSLPPDTPADIRFRAFAEMEGRLLLGAERGYLLTVRSNGDMSLARSPGEEDIRAVVPEETGVLLLDRKGTVWRFTEREEFVRVPIPGAAGIKTICRSVRKGEEGLILLAGEDGLVLTGMKRDFREQRQNRNLDFVDSAANENGFFLLAGNGKLYFSPDGKLWSEAGPEGNVRWKRIYARDKTILLTGGKGELAVSGDGGDTFQEIVREKIKKAGFAPDQISTVLVFSDRRIWLGESGGKVLETQDAGMSWKLRDIDGLEGLGELWLTRSGVILADSEASSLAYAFSGVEISLKDPLEEGDFKAGDVVQLEKNSVLPRLPIQNNGTVPGEWYVSVNAAALPSIEERSPGGGQAVLKLGASAEQADPADGLLGIYSAERIAADRPIPEHAFRLSQKLSSESVAAMKDTSAFRIDFWARAEKDEAAVVELSLSGLNLPVEAVRRHLDTQWRRYSVILIVPWKAVEGQDVRLNFDFKLEGNVYLDQVEMVSAENDILYRGELERIGNSSPSILRLAWLPIGSRYLPSEYWLAENLSTQMKDNGTLETVTSGSLSDALRILEKTQASPWFCIRSRVTESELRHLMQYLFGSNSSEYGAARFEQGSASRWNELFTQIYFEIAEEEKDLGIDQNRQAFVDWVIDVISSTPEYKQVKNQIVFVDGMNYRGGRLLSMADSHAVDFGQVQPLASLEELNVLDERRREAFPRDPGRALGGRQEWIRSFRLPQPKVSAAEYMAQILSLQGEGIQTCLIDTSAEQDQLSSDMVNFLMQSGSAISGKSPLSVRYAEAQDAADVSLLSFAFADRHETLVFIMNVDQEAQLFSLTGRDWDGALARVYDRDGSLLEEHEMDSESGVISILPGVCIVIHRVENRK